MNFVTKPKRIGVHINHWIVHGKEEYPSDARPVYEYRGLFIARNSRVNPTSPKQHYFEVYRAFKNRKPDGFDFYINPDNAFRRLADAVGAIDNYFAELTRN